MLHKRGSAMRCAKSVVLFLIDSLRPDALQQAAALNINRLISSGAYTFTGQTVIPSKTLPCITSLFFSVKPVGHGFMTNTWHPLKCRHPGLFDCVSQAGLHSAAFYNWENLRDLSSPGSLKASLFLKDDKTPENDSDRGLAALAVDYFTKHRVDFAFIYFHQTDAAGHRAGWMSEPYLKAIVNADRCIGTVMKVLSEETVLILTSDHGGRGHTHGTDSPEETTIPFIIRGPEIPRGHRIKQPFKITDIAPTIASFLGIEVPAEWIGKAMTF
ncbi:MAG: alkaline phosphatase family protein [Desulfobacterales bacterium]|nr:MAG: alkaline phosphatase family protein [Desulfobacterales bacterium]